MAGRRTLTKIISGALAITACLLVVSFSMHALQIKHVHPGSDAHTQGKTEVLSEYMHGAEKKLFLYTLASFLLLGAFLSAVARTYPASLHIHKLSSILRRYAGVPLHPYFFSYLRILFTAGILNPKLF